jgi:transposase IS116/IS110/IS902 family protein
VTGQVAILQTLNTQIAELGTVVADHFGRHPDAEIYASQPGLGGVLGVRVLGDDPDRYTDAKARKNYVGTSPITKASGSRKSVLARHARNRRLADALQQWALGSMRGSPGAHAYYQALRDRGTSHHVAPRQLANRLVGSLHGCPKTHTATTNTPPGATTSTTPPDTGRSWDV